MSVFPVADFRKAVQLAQPELQVAVLNNLLACTSLPAAHIPAIHDALLFALAYPSSKSNYNLTSMALDHTTTLLAKALKKEGKKALQQLEGSGLNGTHIHTAFGWDLTKWLSNTFTEQVKLESIDWNATHGMDILKLLVPRIEHDRFLTQSQTIQHWVETLAGELHPLNFLIDLLEKRIPDPALREYLFQLLDIRISVKLNAQTGNRSTFRSLEQPIFFHSKPLQKQLSLEDELAKKELKRIALSAQEQEELFSACRMQLMTLGRETDPVAYADTKQLRMYDCGRGFRVLLIPMRPEKRLPLESFIGYMGFKNRQPIAYGGAWVYGNRARIGLNVFEAYRGGESVWLFSALMRCYKQVVGLEHFLVDPYQLGKGNEEGIKSGAFWFYYRLGFRPQEAELRQLADESFARMQADKNYACPTKLLRKLAGSQMALSCSAVEWAEEPMEIAVALSKWFSRNRGKEMKKPLRELKEKLGYSSRQAVPTGLVALAPWLNEKLSGRLSKTEQSKLKAMFEAKFSGDEIEFASEWSKWLARKRKD